MGDDDYGPDSLQTVFSSGKNLEALAVAHLVDRGLLDYGDTVTRFENRVSQHNYPPGKVLLYTNRKAQIHV